AHSRTLHEALTTFVQLQNLNSTAGAGYLHVWGDTAVFGYGIYSRVAHGQEHSYPLFAALATNLVRGLTASGVNPAAVHLSMRRPSDDSAYREILGVPVRFDQPESGVHLRLADLQHPVLGADPREARRLDAAIRHVLSIQEPSVTRQVQHRLRPMMVRGQVTASDMAEHLGIHVRTLSRRLAAEGTTYQSLLDEVRQQSACELLALTNLRISHIADALAYSAHASFVEAFRRWSGESPSQWRRAFLEGRTEIATAGSRP
ncbi:MAG: helix-turn-helix domain-containing protein, partial [Mycobacterium sp.]